ncbi:MAG: glucose 1-dehydrogenase [Candidatus Heimdallarchaeota archaeon]
MSQFGYVTYTSLAQSKVGNRFLEALKERKLKGTRCTRCNTLYFPPRAYCTAKCLTDEHIEWEELSGEGTILSFSEVHIPPAGFERYTPYTVCVVNLKDRTGAYGGRLLTWVGDDPEDLKIGEPVRVIPEVIEGDRVVYKLLRGSAAESPLDTITQPKEPEIRAKKLAGKVAIVTGAGKGIGREIALEFAREGAKVVVAARTISDIEAVAGEIQELGSEALAIPCDVAKVKHVENLVKGTLDQFGKIDILVNNAGISRSSLLAKMTDDLWNSVININLKGTFNTIRAVIPHFMEKRPLGGKIINFTSTSAKYGNVGQAAYNASKWGIVALTKTAARELARYKVNVNVIMPGFIETAMTADTPLVYKEQTIAQIPLMRTGLPQDVAKATVFLASNDSDYMTGVTVQIDGGLRM